MPTRQVDGPQQPAAHRVVDGGGGARPLVHRGGEVLAGEDLHGRVEGQRRPGRVGAGVGLVPAHALGEAEPVHPLAHLPVPTHVQQPPVHVGDGDHVRVVGAVQQHPLQQRQHRGQGARPAQLRQGGRVDVDVQRRVLGVHPGCAGPLPRLLHQRTQAHGGRPRLPALVAPTRGSHLGAVRWCLVHSCLRFAGEVVGLWLGASAARWPVSQSRTIGPSTTGPP